MAFFENIGVDVDKFFNPVTTPHLSYIGKKENLSKLKECLLTKDVPMNYLILTSEGNIYYEGKIYKFIGEYEPGPIRPSYGTSWSHKT